jgi:hypothetical protein
VRGAIVEHHRLAHREVTWEWDGGFPLHLRHCPVTTRREESRDRVELILEALGMLVELRVPQGSSKKAKAPRLTRG